MEILNLFQGLGSMRMNLASISVLLLDDISPLVLPVHPPDQDAGIADPEDDEPQDDGVALDESRGLIVDMRAHDGKALAEDLGRRPRGAALGEAAGVDAEPGDQEDHAGVQAGGDEAGREDLDVRGRHGHQEDVAQRDRRERAD